MEVRTFIIVVYVISNALVMVVNIRRTGSIIHSTKCVSTGCPRRNVPDFGRVFLMLNYTDITQNTYIQISTVTEIMAREV